MWDWLKKTASQAYNNYVKPAVSWVQNKVVQPTVKAVQNVTRSVSQPRSNNNGNSTPSSGSSPSWSSSNNNGAQQRAEAEAAARKAQTQNAITQAQNAWKNFTQKSVASQPSWSQKPTAKKVDPTAWNNVVKTGANVWNSFYNSKAGQWLANKTPLNGVSNIVSRWRSSQGIADSLNRQSEDASKVVDARQKRLQAIQEEANKVAADFEAGKINYTNAKAQLSAAEAKYQDEKTKLEAIAGNYINHFNKESANLTRPIEYNKNGVVPALSKIWNAGEKVSLKKAWDLAAFISNLPNRVMNTAINAASNKWDSDGSKGVKVPTYDGSTYQNDPSKGWLGNAWQEAAKQKNPYWQKLTHDTADMAGNKWYEYDHPLTKGADVLGDAFSDPGTLIPAGSGFKLWDTTTDAIRNTKTAQRLSKVWNADTQPLVKGLKWLNMTKSQAATAKFEKKVAAISNEIAPDFEKLSDTQAKIYYNIMTGNPLGKVDAADYQAALRVAEKWRARFDKMYDAEKAGGIVYGKNKNYLPGFGDQFKGEAGELAVKGGQQVPWFAKKKVLANPDTVTVPDLIRSHALRDYGSRKVLGTLDTFGEKVMKGIGKVASAPTKAWKASVLGLRPSWYLNNASWNIPASIMGGGGDVLKSYGKIAKGMIKERKWTPKMLRDMPESVTGNTLFKETMGSKLGKPGSWLEGLSRGALYDAMKGKGFSDVDATKQVNRYLFDYSNMKNWERPIQAVVPFWQWQKNIAKFTATMPLNNPKAAKLFQLIKKEFMDKPLEEIPDEQRSFTDPESGKEIVYNPRDGYEGKIKTPWGWRTVPFLPIMPAQLDEIGLSPWLRLSEELLTGKDKFGNSLWKDNDLVDRVLNVFPQTGLIKDYKNKDKQVTENWISPSGYSKAKQGFDPSATNYDEKLDSEKKWERTRNSYFAGSWGNFKQFDRKEYDEKKNYNTFSRDWFSRDFDKEFELPETATPEEKSSAYERKQAAKTELAKKYGYDLQKDIYEGKWRKFDTPATLEAKKAMESNVAIKSNFYKTTGAFWKKYSETSDVATKIQMLIDNPQYAKKSVSQLKDSLSKTMKYAQNKPFWDKYWASDIKTRRKMIASRPDLAKGFAAKDPKKADMAWAYDNLNPYERKKYFASKGYVNDKKLTNAEFAELRKEDWAKKESDMAEFKVVGDLSKQFTSDIRGSIKTKVKRGTKVTWSKSKKAVDKAIWKVT